MADHLGDVECQQQSDVAQCACVTTAAAYDFRDVSVHSQFAFVRGWASFYRRGDILVCIFTYLFINFFIFLARAVDNAGYISVFKCIIK